MRNVFGQVVDPRQDPSNYFTQPPVVTVEQAWAQPGPAMDRIPEQSGAPGFINTLSMGIRRLFGQQIDQAIYQTFNPGSAYPTYPTYTPTPQPETDWMPVIAVGAGAVVLIHLLRR